MKLRDTSDISEYLDQLLEEFESGKVTNAVARIKLGVVRAKLEAKKVEIAACALGRVLQPVSFVRLPAAKIVKAA